jgi:hypothetical protein
MYCRISNFCWFKQLITATELGNQPAIEGEINEDCNSILA